MVVLDSTLMAPWDDGASSPRIEDVQTFVTAPEGLNLVVVRVDTDIPGLYGLGCGTHAFRAKAVKDIVDDYLTPRVIGRSARDVTDIFQTLKLAPYWRGGPVDNSALSGIDMALWDIKAKQANEPVWSLTGGLVRSYLPTYISVFATSLEELVAGVQRRWDEGYRRFRPMIAGHDYGSQRCTGRAYIADWVTTLTRLVEEFGSEAEYVVDVHGRLQPQEVFELARVMDDFPLVYLEDPFPHELTRWLPQLRGFSSQRLAIGETFASIEEFLPLIVASSIDVVRSHISMIGGFSAAHRLATLAEQFGVQTAWHGPLDLSPLGHAANAALGLASPNFGVHEHHEPSEAAIEVFPGAHRADAGRIMPWHSPGWGVGFDEEAARKYPPMSPFTISRLEANRALDGSLLKP